MIPIRDLFVSQNELRYTDAIPDMIQHVKGGGRWDAASLKAYAEGRNLPVGRLIQISRFPSQGDASLLMIHDGHHRVVSTHLAGRADLHDDEVEVTDWTYDQYLAIDFKLGYVTPFDPRSEVRLPDFRAFKDEVAVLSGIDAEAARKLVLDSGDRYKAPRKFRAVFVLANQYRRSPSAIPLPSPISPSPAPAAGLATLPESAAVDGASPRADRRIKGRPIRAVGSIRRTEDYLASLPERNAAHLEMLVDRAERQGKTIDRNKLAEYTGMFEGLLKEARENPPPPDEQQRADREITDT